MRLFLATLLTATVLSAPLPLVAKGLKDAEHAMLSQTVESFSTAMKSNDFEQVIDTLPPRLVNAMAAQVGVPAAQLREMLAVQSAQVMGQSTVDTFATDLSGLKAKTGKMPDGTEVLYTFVPAQVVVTAGGKTVDAPQNLLALKEGGAWYLMRVQSEGHVDMLRSAYPFFKKREFKF